MPPRQAAEYVRKIARAVHYAHTQGVLHRDLKPANVFVCEDGRVKLLDFGLAHLLGSPGSSGAGTPAYMAPEQAAGTAVDERADVWAAGMVLGEMLTGKRPVERTRSPVPRAVVSGAKTDPPRLHGLPRPVARAVKAALSPEPEKRPRDGGSWLAELRSARRLVDRPRRMRRLAAIGSIFGILGLAAAGLATWRIWERQIPGGRPTVAVADFTNETEDKELDGLSGLLITALEQGTQLRVLTRGRMLDVLKQLGRGDVTRIDEALAREVGREARANALLLASIRRLGEAYVVELRALDPLHDEYVFTVSDRVTGKGAVFDLIDRLAVATRSRMGLREDPAPGQARRVASITTASPKAWDLLSRSRAAFDMERMDEARKLVEAALAEDPDFALAHYQLAIMRPQSAIWRNWAENPDPHLQAAERLSDRLPEKERLVLQVIRAQAVNRWDEARELSARLADAFPLDKEAQYLAGAVRSNAHLHSEAVPYHRQALRLDPGYRRAVVALVRALQQLGRLEENLAWVREQVPLARSTSELRALGLALLSENLVEEATVLFRRLVPVAGGEWPPRPLLSHLVYSGRAAEAEQAARDGLSRLPEEVVAENLEAARSLRYALSEALGAQGKFREARQESIRLASWGRYPDDGRLRQRLWIAAASQDFPELVSAIRALENFEGVVDAAGGTGGFALEVAELAADAGRLDLAGPIARRVLDGRTASDPVPTARLLMTAIAAAHEGPPDAALRALAEASEPSDITWLFSGRLVQGHYLRANGDCAGAILAYERALRVKWHHLDAVRFTFLPLLLHSIALCHEKLGDLAKAQERNDELLTLWVNADPDLPLLLEAKAMQARLASAATRGK
jgi:tetratricopeptide (TPR) repeat protein